MATYCRDFAEDEEFEKTKTMLRLMRELNEGMTEVFKSKAIAVGSPTVANSILSPVAGWLEFLKQLKFKKKKAAAFGCYGWSGESVKVLQESLKGAGFSVIPENIRAEWVAKEEDFAAIPALVSALLKAE